MSDALRGIGEKERPVEAEDNNSQQNGYDDFVDWFDSCHSSTDRESSC